MTGYILRERNRRRRLMDTPPIHNLPPQHSQGRDMVEEKRRTSHPLPPLPTPDTITYPEGYIKDPPYVPERYSPTLSDYPRTSISWEIVDGEMQTKYRTSRLSTMDIEKMLDIATE
ncbi:hypothetical protein E1B28_012213 [Marasmius oreades]|uniref:Uncharacterized protein n=1 Tax=Marasmius oreades TaxID=181124 RepID=A0A9P7RR00_9AGAR|nr:uncharacterized protein E1B28_012213 [Marasmius oreades]KAG7088196.1 hypothetical protein E1B28_012213 [Marasmius oreades]